MADITAIVRALNRVSTYGQAKIAVGEALTAIGQAYKLPRLELGTRSNLEAARKPLQAWWEEIKNVPDAIDVRPVWPTKRRLVEKAYIEAAGAGADFNAKNTLSFVDIYTHELGQTVGTVVSTVAGGVGSTAGNILGGLLGGLGPMAVIILVLVAYLALRSKGVV